VFRLRELRRVEEGDEAVDDVGVQEVEDRVLHSERTEQPVRVDLRAKVFDEPGRA
jgi:hypothetical protein